MPKPGTSPAAHRSRRVQVPTGDKSAPTLSRVILVLALRTAPGGKRIRTPKGCPPTFWPSPNRLTLAEWSESRRIVWPVQFADHATRPLLCHPPTPSPRSTASRANRLGKGLAWSQARLYRDRETVIKDQAVWRSPSCLDSKFAKFASAGAIYPRAPKRVNTNLSGVIY